MTIKRPMWTFGERAARERFAEGKRRVEASSTADPDGLGHSAGTGFPRAPGFADPLAHNDLRGSSSLSVVLDDALRN
ncbi:MAG TPA: hypothetical protein VGL47_15335 [Amycolatopsis sp.]|uniref:hypothetical protein n=1 Tax=Amycolatopsis sp. TaxID=37632 RepID=UPI002F3E6086